MRVAIGALALTLAPSLAALEGGPLEDVDSIAGRLLVAAPSMPDSRFAETVIYMVRHDATGAMGVVVNRPIGEISMQSLFDGFGIEGEAADARVRLHFGGPVQYDLGFVLHSGDFAAEETLTVDGRFAMSAQSAVVKALAAGAGPARSLFLFGYAGWAPGQLEAEMARDDWVVVPADESLVFDDEHQTKWRRATAKRTIDL